MQEFFILTNRYFYIKPEQYRERREVNKEYGIGYQRGKDILYITIDVPVLGPLRISETMVVSWIVMILITGLCIWLTHDLKEENISKRQAVAELIVEKANSFVIGNMGEKFRYLIPFVAALFATSVVSNLISLIGLRSPTADLSTEAAGQLCFHYDHSTEDKDQRIWRLSEGIYNPDRSYDTV